AAPTWLPPADFAAAPYAAMSRTNLYASPEDAEAAFYQAIANADLDALMSLWSEDEEVVCVHPTGQQLTGLAAIREGWRQVFAVARIRIDYTPAMQWQGMLLSVHHVMEMLYVGGEDHPSGPLQATNVFARGAHGWRLVCRHVSASSGQTDDSSESRILH
ncbi:MAG: hypothetical protein RIR00_1036, partial [Pseudomonadota bacterium]